MTVLQRLTLAACAALLPMVSALAAEMPNVTGITAVQENGKVTVSWTPVEGDVKKYRIFYSHASIMEQGGVYDDYEDADGAASSHTLSSVPPVATLYVSVMAVGQDDSESPYFMEEATVALAPVAEKPTNGADSSVAAFPPSPTVPMESANLQLLAAISTSSTGVVLTFTHPLSIPEQYKNQAFAIKSGSGNTLAVVRYRLQGNLAILDTAVQTPGKVYQITVHGSVAGKTAAGELVPQEDGMAPLLFTGLLTDLTVPEVQNLKLVAKGNTIEVTWTLPAATIRELQIQQSSDGGRTFGAAVRMDKASKGVTIPGVTSKQLTVLVRVVGPDSAVSRGTQQTVTIGGGQVVSVSSKASVTSSKAMSSASSKPTTKPGTLPSSGLGLATIVALSGAATGMRFMRRKNVPVD